MSTTGFGDCSRCSGSCGNLAPWRDAENGWNLEAVKRHEDEYWKLVVGKVKRRKKVKNKKE